MRRCTGRRSATRSGSPTRTSGSRWSATSASAATTRAEGAPDLVITNAVVLDHWGVVKCDVGVRDGRIVALGKAGNPDIADGVHPQLQIGPSTEILAGEGRILTAGAIDAHVHFICPQVVTEALASG